MSDIQYLFMVLALLYGWECLCWLPRGSMAVRTWLGRRWRVVFPGALLGNHRGGFTMGAPLPPLGTLVCGIQFPFSASADSLLTYVGPVLCSGGRPPQTGKLFKFEKVASVEAHGKKLLINGELAVATATVTYALHLAEWVRTLKELPSNKREAALETDLAQRFDTAELARRWESFRNNTRRLRWLTNILFFYLFAAAPGTIWFLGYRQCWLPLLAGLFCLTGWIALLFRRLHRSLYPNASDDRFTHFLLVLLAPATSIRAQDLLARPLLEQFHPLALVKTFCPKDTFMAVARQFWREITYPALPLCPRGEPGALEAERQARDRQRQVIERFLKQSGISPQSLLAAPKRVDEQCCSYCPRCTAQFTAVSATCPDCGGLGLVPFAN